MTARDVFVVQRTDGVWEAACCSTLCGWGLHLVDAFDDEVEAQAAAREHRKEVSVLAERTPTGIPAEKCPTCGHRYTPTPAREGDDR